MGPKTSLATLRIISAVIFGSVNYHPLKQVASSFNDVATATSPEALLPVVPTVALVSIRFSEEPLSLMRETLHNVQGMKAHSENYREVGAWHSSPPEGRGILPTSR